MDLEGEINKWDLNKIKKDLYIARKECSERSLKHSAKWAAELSFALDQVSLSPSDFTEITLPISQDFQKDYDKYIFAKSCMDCEEYLRAVHFTRNYTSAKLGFIHYYSIYLAGEKKKIDNEVTQGDSPEITDDHIKMLYKDLHNKHKTSLLDGYSLYLYGIILKKLDIRAKAIDIFVESINKEPMHWGAWLELSLLVTDREMLMSLSLPDHWMYYFFLAQAFIELQLNEDSLKYYQALRETHFSSSTHIIAQTALVYHNLRDVDEAIKFFTKLNNIDMYRLENMDTYSNLMYIKEMKSDLAVLANHCSQIDKYRVETCCTIGNYYSLRGEHDKAILNFQRALKLNPNYLSAWTLMGHEYMELKQTQGAIHAYRQAVDINKRDYRAWYGLGQTYEILKMYNYSLYYYRQAQLLRPMDSRMVVAMGEAYDNLNRLHEAKRCFWKARSLGDLESSALIKLAKLYIRLDEEEQAAGAYICYVNETKEKHNPEQGFAYRFLANYYVYNKRLDDAFLAAQCCTEYQETKEEGKALLRQIADERLKMENKVQANNTNTEVQMADKKYLATLKNFPAMNLTFSD